MDARIKSGHDKCVCVHTNDKQTQLRDLAAYPREFFLNVPPSEKSEGAGNAGRPMRPQPRVVCRKHAR
jgi:hypothetical protein